MMKSKLKGVIIFLVLTFAPILLFTMAHAAGGDFVLKWGSTGSEEGEMNDPSGVGIAANGYVYVADTNNNRIQIFDGDGNLKKVIDNGQFMYPCDVTFDANGNMYVADSGNRMVQIFDANGNFLRKWGSSGSGNGQFNFPSGIAVDINGNVYVADTFNNRVQIFDSNGNWKKTIGSYGTSDGQFYYPYGVAVNVRGTIYVTDYYNNRVQVFDSTGAFLGKFGSFGSENGQFFYPYSVKIDDNAYVYVTDINNRRVQIFDNTGRFLAKFGSYGSNDGQFLAPSGVAVSSNGSKIYVGDFNANRVQEFLGFNFQVSNNLLLRLNLAGNGSGSISGTTTGTPSEVSFNTSQSTTISTGSAVTLTSTPTISSIFNGWTGCDTVNGYSCTFIMNNDKVITASFSLKQFLVKFETIGVHGKITGVLKQTVNYGQSASSVTAVPDKNFHFVGWTNKDGFVSVDNPLVINNVMTDMKVEANFAHD